MYLEIEGIEGSGKSTLCRRILKDFKVSGIGVVSGKELDSTFLGKVCRWVLEKTQCLKCPLLEAFVFLAAKRVFFTKVVVPHLRNGSWVLADRGNISFEIYHEATLRRFPFINELKKQVSQNSAKVENSSGTSAITLANKAIDQVKIKGDLRVRYERRDTEYENSDDDYARDRWRSRFRIGGVWKNKKEDWEVGAGLATGGSGATSTNDTWSDDEPFETGDIRLDYAYAKHKMNDFDFQ